MKKEAKKKTKQINIVIIGIIMIFILSLVILDGKSNKPKTMVNASLSSSYIPTFTSDLIKQELIDKGKDINNMSSKDFHLLLLSELINQEKENNFSANVVDPIKSITVGNDNEKGLFKIDITPTIDDMENLEIILRNESSSKEIRKNIQIDGNRKSFLVNTNEPVTIELNVLKSNVKEYDILDDVYNFGTYTISFDAKASRLPTGYTELASLKTDGSQFIEDISFKTTKDIDIPINQIMVVSNDISLGKVSTKGDFVYGMINTITLNASPSTGVEFDRWVEWDYKNNKIIELAKDKYISYYDDISDLSLHVVIRSNESKVFVALFKNGNITNKPKSLPMEGASIITQTSTTSLDVMHKFVVASNNEEMGSVKASGKFVPGDENSIIELMAFPKRGYVFDRWIEWYSNDSYIPLNEDSQEPSTKVYAINDQNVIIYALFKEKNAISATIPMSKPDDNKATVIYQTKEISNVADPSMLRIDSDGRELIYLVPCLNDEGIAGLYDLVSETFYKSNTNSDLIPGSVKFNSYDGIKYLSLTGEMDDLLIEYGTDKNNQFLPDNEYSLSGFKFSHWTYNGNIIDKLCSLSDIERIVNPGINEEIVLEAKWNKNIIEIINGSKKIVCDISNFSKLTTLFDGDKPSIPTPKGYQFTGFYNDKDELIMNKNDIKRTSEWRNLLDKGSYILYPKFIKESETLNTTSVK